MGNLYAKSLGFSFFTLVFNFGFQFLVLYFTSILDTILQFESSFIMPDLIFVSFDVFIILGILFLASRLFDQDEKNLIVEEKFPKISLFIILFLFYAVFDLITIFIAIFSIGSGNNFIQLVALLSDNQILFEVLENPNFSGNAVYLAFSYFSTIMGNVPFLLFITFGVITLFLYENKTVEREGDIDINTKIDDSPVGADNS